MTFRFSVLPYANALPLVHFIRESLPRAELLYRPPRYSVAALLDGEVEAALVPVVDFFTHSELLMIPGLGIGADGDVTSVLLQCHCPLQTVTTIGLDPESKTSNILVKVMVREHFRLGLSVQYTRDVTSAEACLCIGDRALCASPALESYDLAGQWKDLTGLPFVFAVWVVRRSCSHLEEITRILHMAKDRGCQSRRQLAALCSRRLGLPEDRCHEYLTNRLQYDVGPRELEGMNRFGALAADFLRPARGQEIRTAPGHAEKQEMPALEWS